jgi:hypothetical protein
MFTTTRSTRLAVLTAALTLPLAFAACSGTTMPANQPTMAPMTSAPMTSEPMTSAPMTTSPSVPETGKGSFDGMSQDPVATAASTTRC